MKASVIYEIILSAVLILLQVLLLNQISIFGIGTPILYIYFLVKLPMGSNRFYVITLSFIVGFVIDIFLNTPGMNATATTIVAAFRKPLMNLFFSKDDEFENFVPGIYRSSGAFVRFAVTMVLLHQSLLFFIGSFTFFNLTNTLTRIGASALITLVLIFAIDSLMYKKAASES